MLLSRLPLRIATALDLHVLGLPPAFALSQDQTLKLDENFSRLITTFDEVPRLCVREARLASILLARQGVDLKRRPPKSRPAAPRWIHVSDRGRGPQGLRRPRFSFFRFTCQTARDKPSPAPPRGKAAEARSFRSRSEDWSPNISEELQRRAAAPRRRRAVSTIYRGCHWPESTPQGDGKNHPFSAGRPQSSL